MTINLCFLSWDYPSSWSGGGVGTQVRTLGRALVRAGHRVTVVALGGGGLPGYCEDDGIRVHRVRQGNGHWYLHKLPGAGLLVAPAVRELEHGWKAYGKVRELHAREPFDLIEGTETGAVGVALGLKDVPLLLRLHGEPYTFNRYTPDLPLTQGLRLCRLLQRATMRRARLLVAPSYAHAREIAAELGAVHPPIEVIPNCIDVEREPAVDAAPREEATVLFVGRLERCKGVPMLLEAAGHVMRHLPGTYFVLAGASHPSLAGSEIETLVRRHSLDGAVRLVGHIPHDRLALWYQRTTLCVLPSYYESFGIAALEAMAFGIPVVATHVGGLPEVVEDGVSGLLVPPGDVQQLADAMMALLTDAPRREAMGRAAALRARCFRVDGVVPRVESLYQAACRTTEQ